MQLKRKRIKKIHASYTLEGTDLENGERIKYLGVTITSDLRWNTHVSSVCTKANRTLGFLRRNWYSCPQEVKEAAYNGLVRPVGLDNGSSVWDPRPPPHPGIVLQKELESVQKQEQIMCRRHVSMKILNINCQSIINKRSEFQSVLDLEKPDLVIGTESWLNTDHLDSEICFAHWNTLPFGVIEPVAPRGGGGFILVKDTLVASRQKTLETDCEVIWVKIEAAQSKSVYLAAYYRSHENDFHSFEEFCKSVDMVSKKNGHIWILGDLNYPKFHWNDNHVPQVKQGCSFPQQYDDFTNLLDDNNLIKMVSEPIRQDNTLDLFLTNNDSLVS